MVNMFHSVRLVEEKCNGCTRCMIKCPVEAVRLKNSRAVIYNERCIDCGECIRVCPYNAHVAERGNLNEIDKFKVSVAIPSASIYMQFGDYISPEKINSAIKSLGFNEVFDITYACDIVFEITKNEIENMEKPAISPFCPSIVRLVQTNFPELLDHMVKVLNPIEVAARLIREEYLNKGFESTDIGIFYLSPCASWMPLAKYPITGKKLDIDNVIAISDIYPKLLKEINGNKNLISNDISQASFTGLSWATLGGQSKAMNIKEFIAVDGVENVIKILNDVAKGKYSNIDYIEASACIEGCVGGIFLVENPFNAERIASKYYDNLNFTYKSDELSEDYKNKFIRKHQINELFNQKLANDFKSAVQKMKYMNELLNILPGKDCGLCGSPSCHAFAEDVVRGLSIIDDCQMIKTRR